VTGIEYIQKKIAEERKHADAWKLGTQKLSKKDIEVLEKSLSMLDNDEEKVHNLIEEKINNNHTLSAQDEFNHIILQMSESLKDDLAIYTENRYNDILEKTGFGILESGRVYAGAVRVDDFYLTLDGHAIIINIGTYFALHLLVKGVILENFENDFEIYKKDGSQYLDFAKDIFFFQNSTRTREVFFYDYPQEVQIEASARQSSAVVKVLQFISLHELGHIVNNDLEIMDFHARFMNDNMGNEIVDLSSNFNQQHDMEYKADMFALNSLFNNNNSSELSKWSGFYMIFYFLIWLNAIEEKTGKLVSLSHPKPILRAKKLQEKLLEITNGKEYGYIKHLDNIIVKFEKWSM